MIRKFLFILINVFLKWPVLFFLSLLSRIRFLRFDFLFLVYPGSEKDLTTYCPRFFYRYKKIFFPGLLIVGFVGKGNNPRAKRGLVLGITKGLPELSKNPDNLLKLKKQLVFLTKLLKADSIALAGQLPGFFSRCGLKLEKPFVNGVRGTLFSVMETLEQVLIKEGLERKKVNIALVGVGFTGGKLLEALKESGFNITGIDIKKTNKGIVLAENAVKELSCADIIIALTPKGSDFLPYVKFLKKDAIIIDDTHPRIVKGFDLEEIIFYKVALGFPGNYFYPRLPGYKKNWIPGCALEGIYTSFFREDFQLKDQHRFNLKAKDLGFFAFIERY